MNNLNINWKYVADPKWDNPNTEKHSKPLEFNIGNEYLGAEENERRIIKLGLIGVGQSAYPQLTAVKRLPIFEFCYFSDIDKKNRNKLKKRGYDEKSIYTEFRKMLRVKEMSTVVVATELNNHYEHAKEVLNAGKNLLLEKPATLSLIQLMELINISKEKNLCFVCSLHAAFDKTIEWILKKENIAFLLENYGWTNKITRIECEFYDPYLFEQMPQEDRFYSLHDSWLDSGINALSVVSRFVNPEGIVHKISHFQPCKDPNYSNTIVDAKVKYSFNETGVICIHTSWIKNMNRKVSVLTDSNNLEIELDHTAQKINLKTGKSKSINIQEFDNNRLVNQYINLYNDFYTHLTNRTDNLINAFKLHDLLFKALLDRQPSS